jgi:hypothetical protein
MLASRSGQRRGKRHESLALDGDLIALAPTESTSPHLIIEVGGRSKSVARSLVEMLQYPLPPGFVPVVVRLVDARTRRQGQGWRWHLSSAQSYDTPAAMLADLNSIRG